MGVDRKDHARRFLERLAALDADGAVSLVAPEYEGTAVSELPLSGERRVYRGREGLREWIAEVAERWGAFRVQRLRFRDYSDALLAIGENRTAGQRNPFGLAEHRRTFVAVFRFDDELIESVHAYARYEDAVAAEGLEEDGLRVSSTPMADLTATRTRIEELVEEESRLLRQGSAGSDPDRHARLQAIAAELDGCWDLLRRRRAGQEEPLADADVPDPPNELEGPDPEPRHLEHGVHGEGPAPEPGINPNAP